MKTQYKLPPEFKNPVFIIASPRSGSTLLFEILSLCKEFWSVGEEGHFVFENIPGLTLEDRNYHSDRLYAHHVTQRRMAYIKSAIASSLRDNTNRFYFDPPFDLRPSEVRLLEKTPRNILRVSFLAKAFPDAKFIYLFRDPLQNVASMIEVWETTPQEMGYRVIWDGMQQKKWYFIVPPRWQELQNQSHEKIAAFQWIAANQIGLRDLCKLDPSRWISVEYSDLIKSPATIIKKICMFCEISMGPRLKETLKKPLQLSGSTVSAPHPNKWRLRECQIRAVWNSISPIWDSMLDATKTNRIK